MRRKRAKIPGRPKRVDLFYKTLVNSQSKGRGNELIIIMPGALYKILERAQILCNLDVRMRRELMIYGFMVLVYRIYNGERFYELGLPYPSQVLTNYIRTAIIELKLFKGYHEKVTLRSIYTSGRMSRIAKEYGLDLEFESKRYGVKVLSWPYGRNEDGGEGVLIRKDDSLETSFFL